MRVITLTEDELQRIEEWYHYADSYKATRVEDLELLTKLRESPSRKISKLIFTED